MKLELEQICKKFGEKEVLHGITFSVESGKALGLLGRNGAGKTTTVRILMDVFRPNAGKILMDGKTFNPQQYRIGYLPEERGLYPKKKVGEQIVYLAQLRGNSAREARKSMKFWLKRLGVEEYENCKLETLSKGNQQKVQLAQTLVCDPDLIILDEPFSGLDPVNSQILKDVITEQIEKGKLVIFSSHQMSYVEEFCEEIVLINHGEVVLRGNLKEIKREYGENRLLIGVADKSAEELKRILKEKFQDLLIPCGNRKEHVIVVLRDGVRKQEVMRRLAECELDLELFGDYEPSLQEIFVERAGDES